MSDHSIAWFADEPSPVPIPSRDDPFGGDRVVEYVLGRNFVPLRKEPNRALVKLFNTDPKNWDSFMFAYDLEKQKARIESVDILRDTGALDQVLATIGMQPKDKSGPIPVQYEIKRSKTSGNLTLYIFVYELTDFERDFGDMKSEVAEIPLAKGQRMRLPRNTASNVEPVLTRLAASLAKK